MSTKMWLGKKFALFCTFLFFSIGLTMILFGCQKSGSQTTFTAGDIPGDVLVPIYPGSVSEAPMSFG
jgi:hypothetical protein